jgi:hypothetical protein
MRPSDLPLRPEREDNYTKALKLRALNFDERKFVKLGNCVKRFSKVLIGGNIQALQLLPS